MKKLWEMARDLIFCFLPFASAAFVCHGALSNISRTDLKDWEPGFYSFLPMSFFMVGVIVFLTLREIRELRLTIVRLRSSRE